MSVSRSRTKDFETANKLGICGREHEFVPIDLADEIMQRPQRSVDLLRRRARRLLPRPRDRRCRKHIRQMRLDRLPCVMEDRPRPKIDLRHPKRLLDIPQVTVRTHDFTRNHVPNALGADARRMMRGSDVTMTVKAMWVRPRLPLLAPGYSPGSDHVRLR